MNRTDLLHLMMSFSLAEHEYMSLIVGTFLRDGQFEPAISWEEMQRIRAARKRRDELEQEMYTAWASEGVGTVRMERLGNGEW